MSTTFCHTHGYAHHDRPDARACYIETWDTVPGIVIDSVEIPADREFEPFHLLAAGRFGYLDSVHGPVPVKVLDVGDEVTTVKVTAPRPGYRRGEHLHLSNPAVSLLHREQVSKRTGRVNGRLRLITNEGNLLP